MSTKIIKNRILTGLLRDFEKDFSMSNEESKSFENFVNYVIISKYAPEAFDDIDAFTSVNVDKKSTFGIDAFAIIINDRLIVSPEDILASQTSGKMDIRVIFIQTKRSEAVDTGDLLKLLTSVKDFLSVDPKLPLSEDLRAAKDLFEQLFKTDFNKTLAKNKLVCDVFYVTSGKESSDSQVLSLLRQNQEEMIGQLSEFKEISVRQVGSDYLIDSYNEIENKYSVEINFDKNVVDCGEINKIEQAYIGYLPVAEFLKLIQGTDGNIRKNLFYENVRDFQGEKNTVNSEMSQTLLDKEKIAQFLLLNNGVTVVTKDLDNIRGNRYSISDYYIINGCQTSNVIYQNKDRIKDNLELKIPIKIVHTTDNNVITSLIKSTNRQTPVPDEAFASLERFHKNLQLFYKAVSDESSEKLYYERRSKEYLNNEDVIERSRVVNLHSQIRSFASVMLGEPQLVMSNNPKSILKEHGRKMFQDDHKFEPYFLSSLFLFSFTQFANSKQQYKKYLISKYWICWIARIISIGEMQIGNMNSQKVASNCEKIQMILMHEENKSSLFKEAISIFDSAKNAHREIHGTQNSYHLAKLIRLKTFKDLTWATLEKTLQKRPMLQHASQMS